MDRDAAAIEFSGAHRSDEHAGSKLFTFQVLIPFKQQIDICIIPLQWVKVNKNLQLGMWSGYNIGILLSGGTIWNVLPLRAFL